jgi:type VI protein secretion system component VasK
VNDIGFGKHMVIFVALVINLWVGGDLLEAWQGHAVRTVFELAMILGYMVLILGITAPLPWRRKKDETERPNQPR